MISFFGITEAMTTVQVAAKDKERNISWDGSGHFEQLVFWQLSEHFSCEPIWGTLPQMQPFQSTFQTRQITDKNIRTGRTGVPPLRRRLTHSACTSGLFQVIKLENCTVVICQLLGRRVVPKETRPIEVTALTLHRRSTSRRARFLQSSGLHNRLAFPACSINRTIHLKRCRRSRSKS